MGKIWHIGLAVPDLGAGMNEVGEVFGLTWREVHERATTVIDEHGTPYDVVCRFTFSHGSPFAVEMWEAIPDTPLATPATGYLHHIGYWVDDLDVENERLTALNYPAFMTGPSLLINYGPGGLMLEPCDVLRDRPFLRDLFPPESPLYGVAEESENG